MESFHDYQMLEQANGPENQRSILGRMLNVNTSFKSKQESADMCVIEGTYSPTVKRSHSCQSLSAYNTKNSKMTLELSHTMERKMSDRSPEIPSKEKKKQNNLRMTPQMPRGGPSMKCGQERQPIVQKSMTFVNPQGLVQQADNDDQLHAENPYQNPGWNNTSIRGSMMDNIKQVIFNGQSPDTMLKISRPSQAESFRMSKNSDRAKIFDMPRSFASRKRNEQSSFIDHENRSDNSPERIRS